MSGLSLVGLRKTFEKGTPNAKLALDDVSLEVAPGDFITVLGSNGAGKSTLFNAILGKFRLDRGRVIYDVEGEERSRLTMRDLTDKFRQASGRDLDNDRMLLGIDAEK